LELLTAQMAKRREGILAAAREIIGELGYEALTMRDLARASRVTVPTIYNLVGGKETVLFAAVEEQTQRFVAGIEQVDVAAPAARVLSVVDACTRELLRLPRYYRSLLRLLFTSEAAAPARAAVGRALGAQLARGVRDLRDSGELVAWADAETLVDQLGAQLAFVSMRWAAGELGREGLRAASAYGVCLVLMSLTEGRSRREFERVAREVQPRLRSRGNGRAPLRAAGAS
jgi:AcrR family transcriptional regulator